MRTTRRLIIVAATVTVLSIPAAAALADPPAGAGGTFGQHVAACAHTMNGFTGDHNPGMHHGASGWDGQQCQ
jgi:hypothetical protein